MKNGICQKHGFYKGKCLKCQESYRAMLRAYRKEYDKTRINAEFYNSSRWRKTRLIQLTSYPVCAMCGHIATIADHIKEINDGGAKYDLDNLQSLCLPCHNTKTFSKKTINIVVSQEGG